MKIFDSVLIKKPKRNVFDLSHEVKMTLNMGELVPFVCQEVLPGDTFMVNAEILMRMQPMLSPVMHRVDVYTHFFFVPNRIIWSGWEKFITGDAESTEEVPFFLINNANKAYFAKGTLADYFGIPTIDPAIMVTNNVEINALPFMAYQKIWNDFYRDQNLQTELEIDAPIMDYDDYLTLRMRAWEKDYFTSALPWAQKGDEVSLPLSDTAPLIKKTSGFAGTQAFTVADGSAPANGNIGLDNTFIEDSVAEQIYFDISNTHEADLSEATAITVNDLRRSMRLQEWLERNARAGSRYIESLFAHFGVKSSDARLQRPEYLGGGKSPMTISEVLSMVGTAEAPQGQMTGHGLSLGNSNRFKKFFEEHGYVIGIMSVLPRTAYVQGINKMFLKSDYLDFYWPEFAQLGEQEINERELYMDYTAVASDVPFGYQSRYAEYKYMSSRVAGDMRDNMEYWHMARKFSSKPALNAAFIQSDPTHRIFAVTDPAEDKLICQIYNNVQAIRPIPYFNIPTI